MPGTERSGRRKLPKPHDLGLPDPGDTEKSLRFYLLAIARAVGEGKLDPRYADSMTTAAKGALQAMRQEHGRHEIDELRTMVEQAKDALRSARKRISDERDKLSDAKVSPDGADPGATAAPQTQ